jgi:DNA-binding GntR family transcriptional regulator
LEDVINLAASDAGPLDLEERRDSLVGQIAGDIAREITEGLLPPGADLNSVELAARFRTSRTPVREALILLEKEGLVEIPPRRRPRVAHVSMAEIEELYRIRVVLNELMIREFIRNAGPADFAQADAIFQDVERLAAINDVDNFLLAVATLHRHWEDRCGNASLQRLLRTWKMRLSVARLGSPHDVKRSLADNGRLLVACRERDETLAVAMIASMTRYGLDLIRARQAVRPTVAQAS